MTWLQIVGSVIGVVTAPLLAYLAARVAARNGERQAHTADWTAFSEQQRKERQEERTWMEAQLAERDTKLEDIRREVRSLKDWRAEMEQKYRVAVAYIRRLVAQLQKHVDPDDIEAPPPEIHPDL